MKRTMILVFSLSLVAGLSWWIHAASNPPAEHRGGTTAAPQTIYANGRIEGRTPETELHTWDAGRVTEILVAEGDQVSAGQVLLRLDDQRHRLAVALAEAELARAEAELERLINGARPHERHEANSIYQAKAALLERAQLTWTRTQQLHAKNVLTQEQADNDRTEVARLEGEVAAARARAELLAAPAREDERRVAEAQVATARSQLEQAKLSLARRELRAPYAARVLEINVEAGEMTRPDGPDAPLTLADTSRLRVRAFVEELEAPLVTPGMSAEIRADGLPTVFRGTVARVSPRMNSKSLWSNQPGERYDTRTREVWIDLEDGAKLIIGLRVDVEIQCQATSSSIGTGD